MDIESYWNGYTKNWNDFPENAFENILIFDIEDIDFLFEKAIQNNRGTNLAARLLGIIGEEYNEYSEIITKKLLDLLDKKIIKIYAISVIDAIWQIENKKLINSSIEILTNFRKYIVDNESEFDIGTLFIDQLLRTIDHVLRIFKNV